MEPSAETPIEDIDSEIPEENKIINWIYELIVGIPLIVFSIVLGILTLVTPMEFIGDWQIWTFLIMVPVLGFIGGFFLKREEVQKSLSFSSLFLIAYTALATMGLSGGLEIMGGSSALEILIAFSGGLLWGGGFGLIDCIFLIIATWGAYGISTLIKRRK